MNTIANRPADAIDPDVNASSVAPVAVKGLKVRKDVGGNVTGYGFELPLVPTATLIRLGIGPASMPEEEARKVAARMQACVKAGIHPYAVIDGNDPNDATKPRLVLRDGEYVVAVSCRGPDCSNAIEAPTGIKGLRPSNRLTTERARKFMAPVLEEQGWIDDGSAEWYCPDCVKALTDPSAGDAPEAEGSEPSEDRAASAGSDNPTDSGAGAEASLPSPRTSTAVKPRADSLAIDVYKALEERGCQVCGGYYGYDTGWNDVAIASQTGAHVDVVRDIRERHCGKLGRPIAVGSMLGQAGRLEKGIDALQRDIEGLDKRLGVLQEERRKLRAAVDAFDACFGGPARASRTRQARSR